MLVVANAGSRNMNLLRVPGAGVEAVAAKDTFENGSATPAPKPIPAEYGVAATVLPPRMAGGSMVTVPPGDGAVWVTARARSVCRKPMAWLKKIASEVSVPALPQAPQ